LRVEGRVPGIDDATFKDYAQRAKADSTVTKALAGVPEIEVEAQLAS
jgi:osmotically inducible protein OsmC